MNRHAKSWIPLALLLVALPLTTLSAGERWLHVRVEDSSSGGENVSVNVPLSVVHAFLPLVRDGELDGGRLRVDLDEIEGVRLRDVLAALNDAPDAVFVTVNGPDEQVRVAKENGYLLVHVDERHGDREQVRVRLPIAVAQALVTDDPEEFDLSAALRELEKFDGEDLVRIESTDERVRVWIDSREDGS